MVPDSRVSRSRVFDTFDMFHKRSQNEDLRSRSRRDRGSPPYGILGLIDSTLWVAARRHTHVCRELETRVQHRDLSASGGLVRPPEAGKPLADRA